MHEVVVRALTCGRFQVKCAVLRLGKLWKSKVGACKHGERQIQSHENSEPLSAHGAVLSVIISTDCDASRVAPCRRRCMNAVESDKRAYFTGPSASRRAILPPD